MKQKIIILSLLIFIFANSVYSAEMTTQIQREAPQSINPTMTATVGDIYFSPRFYLAGKRYNFQEIQRVFDLTNEETRFFFNKSKNAWRTTFQGIHDEANDLVQKTVEIFNRFIAESAENRARVLDELQKMRIEEERDKVRRVLDRDAHFERRKNEFIGGKISLGFSIESDCGKSINTNSKYDSLYSIVNPGAEFAFRYARFYGEEKLTKGFILEAMIGWTFLPNRNFFGLNLMYGLKIGLCYMGFGGFFYLSSSKYDSGKMISFDSGLMMVIGLELKGLGKSKFFIGIELKGTPFALVKRLPGSDRIRYFSIALEMGVGY